MTIAHIAAAKGSVGVVKELMKFNKLVVNTARNRVRNIYKRDVLIWIFLDKEEHWRTYSHRQVNETCALKFT